ncbi:MAG: tail fiber domain-containing protein [Opitutales bacterium]|nr:tail fiber domain-containing protein [Opitutales bacterium]
MKHQILTLLKAALAVSLFPCATLIAQVPQTIHYQGKVTVDGEPFDGTGYFKFALIYDGTENIETAEALAIIGIDGEIWSIFVPNGGSGYTSPPEVTIIDSGSGSGAEATAVVVNGAVDQINVDQGGSGYSSSVNIVVEDPPVPELEIVWSNDGTTGNNIPVDAVALPVSDGIFSVALGDIGLGGMSEPISTSAFAELPVFLRVWFDDGQEGFQLLSPDQPLASVPYAFSAGYAEDVAEGSVSFDQIDPAIALFSRVQGSDAIEKVVAEQGILRISPFFDPEVDQDLFSPMIRMGHVNNFASNRGATVSGGGTASSPNLANGIFSTIGGGLGNEASGGHATIGGGLGNQASGLQYATVAGGQDNTASNWAAMVGGGQDNEAGGGWSTVGGGVDNSANNLYSSIGGGQSNEASGDWSTVAGGVSNTANNQHSAIGGGQGNEANGDWSSIAGGKNNTTNDRYSAIGGGSENEANEWWTTVSGGFSNEVSGQSGTVAGGALNIASHGHSTIGGGRSNEASENFATVSGGLSNEASGSHAAVSGGRENIASGGSATISGGRNNTASGSEATVGGGITNRASDSYATVTGGNNNEASAFAATIGGGRSNEAAGQFSMVPGGDANEALGNYSFAAGHRAKVDEDHHGTFIWADSTWANFSSTDEDQFLIRAGNGVGIGTNSPSNQLSVAGRADFSQRVGIGTNAPTRMLHLKGNSVNTPTMLFQSDNAPANQRVAALFMNVTSGHMSLGRMNDAGTSLQETHMRIRADNGFVGMGTTNPQTLLHLDGLNTSTSNPDGLRLQNGDFNYWDLHLSHAFLQFNRNGTNLAYVNHNGEWNTASDERLKQDIRSVDSVLSQVKGLDVVSYHYKDRERSNHPQIGFLAQNVVKYFPQLASRESEDDYWSLNYTGFGVLAIRAIQEQQEVIEAQEARIAELEEQLAAQDDLETRLTQIETMLAGEELASSSD